MSPSLPAAASLPCHADDKDAGINAYEISHGSPPSDNRSCAHTSSALYTCSESSHRIIRRDDIEINRIQLLNAFLIKHPHRLPERRTWLPMPSPVYPLPSLHPFWRNIYISKPLSSLSRSSLMRSFILRSLPTELPDRPYSLPISSQFLKWWSP